MVVIIQKRYLFWNEQDIEKENYVSFIMKDLCVKNNFYIFANQNNKVAWPSG
jgi:hypothetical protein